MTKAYAALVGISMLGLAVAAHAGAPMQLSDWQMQAVTAGSANANATFQTSVHGQNAAIQSIAGPVAAVSPLRSFAQSPTGVLATGTSDASIASDTLSPIDGRWPRPSPGGHSPRLRDRPRVMRRPRAERRNHDCCQRPAWVSSELHRGYKVLGQCHYVQREGKITLTARGGLRIPRH